MDSTALWWNIQAVVSALMGVGFIVVALRYDPKHIRNWPHLAIIGLALIAFLNALTSYATGAGDDDLRNAAGAAVRGVLAVLLFVGLWSSRREGKA